MAAPPPVSTARKVTALAVLGLFLLGAAALVVAGFYWEPETSPLATPTAPAAKEPEAPDPLTMGLLNDPSGQALLATQSEQKRNQILVIDLYSQLLGRYPNAAEQRAWFGPRAKEAEALERLRERAATDDEVASYIAGTILDEPAVKARAPALRQASAEENVLTAATIVARAVGLRSDIPRAEDARLTSWLARDTPVPPGQANRVSTVKSLLARITGTSDVGEHFVEDANEDGVELAAMRTFVRSGKLLVLNGNELDGPSRYVVVFGFDRDGDFLVRDPAGHLPEKVKGAFLMAFLRHPGLMAAPGKAGAGAGGFWVDAPGAKTRVKCVSHPVANRPPAAEEPDVSEPEPALSFDSPAGETGVIPGAQVNLTPLRIPPGEHTLRGTLSITAAQIDAILTAAHSPAAGNGHAFVKFGQYYNVDPIYALAFFRKESVYGAHPRWIGRKGGGDSTRNVGNIRYVGRPNPQREPQYSDHNGFRDYATWEDGIHDWFKLIAQDSNYAGLHTVERIIPKYAPAFENDTNQYLKDVVLWVSQWRGQTLEHAPAPAAKVVAAVRADVEMDCR